MHSLKQPKILAWWTLPVQEYISCICCILMLVGFLFSRGLLSIAMIALLLNALHPARIRVCWTYFRQSPFALSCLLLFLVYFVSGFWSSDTSNWLGMLQIKLPFIFMPFAMFSLPLQQVRYRKLVLFAMLFVLLMGMLYGYSYLLTDPKYLSQQRHLPSPLEGDYIRFTIALVLGLQFVVYLLLERSVFHLKRYTKYLLAGWALVTILYIHLQAAKTGLLGFYLVVGVYLLFAFLKGKKWLGILALTTVASLTVIAVFFVPSVNRQLREMAQEQKIWKADQTKQFHQTSSIVPRLVSYTIAADIIKEHPILGTGAGDLKDEMDKRYIADYPNIIQESRLLPHNQFICTAALAGIPLGLSVVILLISPLFRTRIRIYALVTMIVMALGFMIEPMLETQYGVFTYLFFTMIWVSLLRKQRA
jgi:O-antigen ligase